MRRKIECPKCSGLGYTEPGDVDGEAVTRTCPECNGDGEVVEKSEIEPKNKGGRPPAADPRKPHQIRFSAEELQTIVLGASLDGSPWGTWVRELAIRRAKWLIRKRSTPENR